MFKFNIKLTGLEKGKEDAKAKSQKVLMLCMMKMEELAIKYAPVDQGFLRLNISLFPQILSNNYVLTSNADYSAAIEYGSRPHWAPIDPLKDWAKRKIGDESVAYAIQANIAEYGIKAHPYFRPALNEVLNFWYDFYSKQVFTT
jgi:hypothetical protein